MLVRKYVLVGIGIIIPFVFLFQSQENSVYQMAAFNALLAFVPLGLFSLLHKKATKQFEIRPVIGYGIFLFFIVYFTSAIIGHGVMTLILLGFIVAGIFGLIEV